MYCRHCCTLLIFDIAYKALGFIPTNYEYVPPSHCAAVGYQKILLPALCRMQSGLFDKCERVGIVPLKMTFMPRQLGFYYSEPPLNNRPQQRRRRQRGGASAGPGRRLQKDPPRLYDSWRHTEKGSNSKKDEAIVTSSCGPASP